MTEEGQCIVDHSLQSNHRDRIRELPLTIKTTLFNQVDYNSSEIFSNFTRIKRYHI